MAGNEKYFLGTLTKTLSLLELFREHDNLGLTEISHYLSLSKSNVYRIVITLEHWGYLEKTKDLKYKLGTKLLLLGSLVLDRQEIIPIARPFIKELVKKVKETAYLAILTNNRVVTYLTKVNTEYSIRVGTRIGRTLPAYTTADGKIILAYSDPEIIEDFLQHTELKEKTDFTITSKIELREKLEEIRQRGFAIDNEETEIGLIAVAAPIYNILGKVFASVSIAGPAYRINENLDSIRDTVIKTAEEISHALNVQKNRRNFMNFSLPIAKGTA